MAKSDSYTQGRSRGQAFSRLLTVLLVPEVASASRLVDVGSGAGFPGIPLKVAKPDLSVTLVDSLENGSNSWKL